ncbi:MAG: glycosyltransferase family 2 protein, partial [Candidatus Binatia bacterium]
MDLSVIICTWNNCRQLATTLSAVLKCRIPENLQWEVVVVNNNSRDNTEEVVQAFRGSLPVVYVYESQQGLSRARNAGLKRAAGRLIVFTDDDVKPCVEWVASYWSAFEEKPTGFYFGGPIVSVFEGERPDEGLLRLAPHSVKGLDWGRTPKILQSGECFLGANWACPTDALKEAGGFDVQFGLDPSSPKLKVGEETDLMGRLIRRGLSPWYIPSAWLFHSVPATKCTIKHIAERAEAQAASLVLSQQPEIEQVPMVAGVPRWMYRRALTLWLYWLKARARGNRGYMEYLDFRSMLGRM